MNSVELNTVFGDEGFYRIIHSKEELKNFLDEIQVPFKDRAKYKFYKKLENFLKYEDEEGNPHIKLFFCVSHENNSDAYILRKATGMVCKDQHPEVMLSDIRTFYFKPQAI